MQHPAAPPAHDDIHVRLVGVEKRFGGVTALSGIDLDVRRGRVHALVGENGAGKSTLGKLIAGVHRLDTGAMYVDGVRTRYNSPREALVDGTTIIAQELMLVPQLSVIHNVFLGSELARLAVVRTGSLRQRYDALCEQAGFSLPPGARVDSLRVADCQKVEILRAMARNARLIVMDEPTAALSADEASRLIEIMRGLRDQGTTIVFVSHFLDQVLAIADEITVLRDGNLIRSAAAAGETAISLVDSMLGHSLSAGFPTAPQPPADAPVVLSVRGVRTRMLQDISLDVRAGEIVGLAGLIGSGRTEVARAIFGADPLQAGEVSVDGIRRRIRRPHDAARAGIAMLAESRKDEGLHIHHSIRNNVSIVHLSAVSRTSVINRRAETTHVRGALTDVGVAAPRLSADVATLSGGNQQKSMFAKWLFQPPRVFIIDEPTRGVDVGSKRTIYELVVSLASQGMAVLLISSELEEVLGLSHRVLVMRRGRITAEFEGEARVKDAVLHAAFAAGEVVA